MTHSAKGAGGGLNCIDSHTIVVLDSELEGNVAEEKGGGIALANSGLVTVNTTRFRRNTVGTWRGFGNLTTEIPFAPLLYNFTNSTTLLPQFNVLEPTQLDPIHWGIRGAGLMIDTSTRSTVDACVFQSNAALSAGLGGGLYIKSDYYIVERSNFRYSAYIV